MMTVSLLRRAAILGLACALAACSRDTSAPASNAGTSATANKPTASTAPTWIDHGATACDTYLTPAVVGEILKKPEGHSKRLAAQSCNFETPDFSSINITLTPGGVAVLDAHMAYLGDVAPLAGVGDKAVRTASGIEAAKGTDRICSVDVMPPFAAKISGDALAQKLGAICNQLLALP